MAPLKPILGRPSEAGIRLLRDTGAADQLGVTRRQRGLGLLLAAATAAAWGLETVLTAVAAEGSTTLAVNAVRVPSAAMLCLSVALRCPGAFDAAHRALQDRRTQWWLILASLLGWVAAGTLYVESIKLVGVTSPPPSAPPHRCTPPP